MPAKIHAWLSEEWEDGERKQLLEGLYRELDECTEVGTTTRNRLKIFLPERKIWHISDIDYAVRQEYEKSLHGTLAPNCYATYLNEFDWINRHSVLERLQTLAGEKAEKKYLDKRILYLCYYPDPAVINATWRTSKKNALVWNFKRDAPEILKQQIFATFQYILKEYVNTRSLTNYLEKPRFLKEKHPEVESCQEISREIIEDYLTYLNTEILQTKEFRSELNRLRSVLEMVGKLYHYEQLYNIILNRDIPPATRAEFKTYSDAELKRINSFLVKVDEQTAREMIFAGKETRYTRVSAVKASVLAGWERATKFYG